MTETATNWLNMFHLLRPWVLIALPVIAILWWRIRRPRATGAQTAQGLPEHLANALTVHGARKRRIYPVDGVAASMVLLAIAGAGPCWSRIANPLQAQTAPLVVAFKTTESMENTDIQPTRRERGIFRIRDLVARRAGAETALIAYAKTAHRVVPLTTDVNILSSFLQGLKPGVMPADGDNAFAALELAMRELERSETPGSVLFVLDDFSPAAVAEFNGLDHAPITVLIAAPDNVSLPHLEKLENANLIRMTSDDSDLNRIERQLRSDYQTALAGDENQAWDDKGWWFAWPSALLLLLWFRRGWTMRWVLSGLLIAGMNTPAPVSAGGVSDWFLTPDQQGRRAYEQKKFTDAAGLFQDEMWRALALFKDGQYEAAAGAYAAIEGADAAFGEGMARLRNRQYRPGVRAFERALELRPDFAAAQENLAIAQAMVTLVEETQASSDTGEETGIGADDTVFDNESGLGEITRIDASDEGAAIQSTEQWMRTVDTDISDFLKSRFRLENAGIAE